MTVGILGLATEDQNGLDVWLETGGAAIKRTVKAVNKITESEDLTVSKLAVAAGLLSDLARDL
jgi:glutamate dehydrogenase